MSLAASIRNMHNFQPTFEDIKKLREEMSDAEDFLKILEENFFETKTSQILSKIDMLETNDELIKDIAHLSTELFAFIFFIRKVQKQSKGKFSEKTTKIYFKLMDRAQYKPDEKLIDWIARYYVVSIALKIIEENQTEALKFASNELGAKGILEKKESIVFFMQELLLSNSPLVQYNINELYNGFKDVNEAIQNANETETETILHENDFEESDDMADPFPMDEIKPIVVSSKKSYNENCKNVSCAEECFSEYSELLFNESTN